MWKIGGGSDVSEDDTVSVFINENVEQIIPGILKF